MLPRILGKPYEADCEWVLVQQLSSGQTSTVITSGMVARDSSGRRLDQREVEKREGAPERQVWMATIYDPISQTLSHLLLQSGRAITLPVTVRVDESGLEIPTIEIEGKRGDFMLDLPQCADGIVGERMMEGVHCTGYYRKLGAGSVEYWFADELEATIWSRATMGDLEVTTRVYNILESEPDPELFVVPPQDPDQIGDSYMVGESGLIIGPS
jgi:hypothetical protein